MVLDEPTNDLDAETLELLEELVTSFNGTMLLVSHDRAFLNNVVTSTLVFEGDGFVREYDGGYDDYIRQKAANTEDAAQVATPKKAELTNFGSASPAAKTSNGRRLSWKEER